MPTLSSPLPTLLYQELSDISHRPSHSASGQVTTNTHSPCHSATRPRLAGTSDVICDLPTMPAPAMD